MMAEKVKAEGRDWAPLWFFYGTMSGPCHLFWAAYENKVGWEWDFMASGWHRGRFEGKNGLVASISALYNSLSHNR